MKTGRNFEELVTLIEQHVHQNVQVTHNEKLRDKDTGRLRQIDIALRMTDRHVQFLGIIEVRDRGRPVGVEFVEQVAKKREAVGADAAFIVSKSGFFKSADEKAASYGIRTLSYDEARSDDWSGWIKTRVINQVVRKFNNIDLSLTLDIFENLTFNQVFCAPPDPIKAMSIVTEDGEPLVNGKELTEQLINSEVELLFGDIVPGKDPVRKQMLFDQEFRPRIFVRADQGDLVKIKSVLIEADFEIEEVPQPLRLMRYRLSGSSESIAEVAVSEIEFDGRRMQLEIIAPGASQMIEKGAAVLLRHSVIE